MTSRIFEDLRRRVRLLLRIPSLAFAVVAPLGLAAGADTAPSDMLTVDALWAGFDPRAQPLDAKVVNERVEDGIVVRTVYYTSEVVDGFAVRVIGYYAFPKGGERLPAILHMHGGGQNATRAYVVYWAKRGYAALSVNWGGRPLEGDEANGTTDWGPLPYRQNSVDQANVYAASPNGRFNSWFHWAILGRRGITFLERQPEVNPARIGLFGVSMGGRLTWLVAGTDERIRCAASIYGAAMMGEPVEGVPDSEYIPAARRNPFWRTTLDAYAYAPTIRAPFLFLSAENDFFGRLDQVDVTLARIPGRSHWRVLAPHFSHHVSDPEASALPSWMDRWLKDGPAWPLSPEITLSVSSPGASRALFASAWPDHGRDAASVSIRYSTGLFPQARFWRSVAAYRDGDRWNAKLPLTQADEKVRAYASVTYRSGLVLSSPIASIEPERLKSACVVADDAPTHLIDDFSRGTADWFVTEGGPNVIPPVMPYLAAVEGDEAAIVANGLMGSNWRAFTRKVGDPKWRGPAGAGISLKVRSAQQNSVTIIAVANYESLPLPSRVFSATVSLKGGGWETVSVAMQDFKDAHNGRSLESWNDINLLGVAGQYRLVGNHMKIPDAEIGEPWSGPPPLIGRIEWMQLP